MATRFWVFADKPEGTYGHRIWDMSWIIPNRRYTLKKSERQRSQVRVGDVVYMRIYGQAYIGRFVVGGHWQPCPELDVNELAPDNPPGTFAMRDVVLWSPPVRQDLVLHHLSNGNLRARVIEITREDGLLIEAVQRDPTCVRRELSRTNSTPSLRDEIAVLKAKVAGLEARLEKSS
ncbi:MAG: hypothetical protein ABFE07_07955 [Armatimonadia bacterium]